MAILKSAAHNNRGKQNRKFQGADDAVVWQVLALKIFVVTYCLTVHAAFKHKKLGMCCSLPQ